MKSLMKYFTSAPIMATVVLVGLSVVMIELNAVFPGLQYGTYFHSLP
ncbi:MAG: photosystem I reaction center subunit IX [Cyanobacteria bacterium J06576_12]